MGKTALHYSRKHRCRRRKCCSSSWVDQGCTPYWPLVEQWLVERCATDLLMCPINGIAAGPGKCILTGKRLRRREFPPLFSEHAGVGLVFKRRGDFNAWIFVWADTGRWQIREGGSEVGEDKEDGETRRWRGKNERQSLMGDEMKSMFKSVDETTIATNERKGSTNGWR